MYHCLYLWCRFPRFPYNENLLDPSLLSPRITIFPITSHTFETYPWNRGKDKNHHESRLWYSMYRIGLLNSGECFEKSRKILSPSLDRWDLSGLLRAWFNFPTRMSEGWNDHCYDSYIRFVLLLDYRIIPILYYLNVFIIIPNILLISSIQYLFSFIKIIITIKTKSFYILIFTFEFILELFTKV